MKTSMLMLFLFSTALFGCQKSPDPSKLFFTAEPLYRCDLITDADKCGASNELGMCCTKSTFCVAPPGDMKGPAVLVSATPSGDKTLACAWAYR